MIQGRRRARAWLGRIPRVARRVAALVSAIAAAYIALLLNPDVLLAHEVRVQNLALHASKPCPRGPSALPR